MKGHFNRVEYKQELISNWKYSASTNRYLWGTVAEEIYHALKTKSPKEAYNYFSRMRKKYRNLAASSFYVRAMKEVKPLMYKRRR